MLEYSYAFWHLFGSGESQTLFRVLSIHGRILG